MLNEKHLYRFGFNCYDWIVAESLEQALEYYKKEECGEDSYLYYEILNNYLNKNPTHNSQDFLKEFVRIEDDNKEFEIENEDFNNSIYSTKIKVKAILEKENDIPCWIGASY